MEREVILNISIKKEREGGYSVICTDLDVASQGETVDEALDNIKEAVELYLESAQELGIMDQILEKLGLTEEDFQKNVIAPKIFRTEVPFKLAIKQ